MKQRNEEMNPLLAEASNAQQDGVEVSVSGAGLPKQSFPFHACVLPAQ